MKPFYYESAIGCGCWADAPSVGVGYSPRIHYNGDCGLHVGDATIHRASRSVFESAIVAALNQYVQAQARENAKENAKPTPRAAELPQGENNRSLRQGKPRVYGGDTRTPRGGSREVH